MIRNDDVRMFYNGEEIKSTSSATVIRTSEDVGTDMPRTFSGSGTLSMGPLIDPAILESYVGTAPPPLTMNVVLSYIVKPLPRTPKSKKKRIQKKWAKRLRKSIRSVNLKNVTIGEGKGL